MKRLLIAALVLAAAAGCGKSTKGQVILMIPRATDGQFWRTVRAGASQAAKDQGGYLEWPSAFRPDDIKSQANVLRAARARAKIEGRPYAFAFAPIWGVGVEALIEDWEQDGLRLDTFDEEFSLHNGATEHVGTRNEQAGRAAALALIDAVQKKALGRKANIALLRLNPLAGSTSAREAGFLKVFDEQAAQAVGTITSRDHYAVGVGVESAFEEGLAMIDEMERHDTPIDAVFSPNESTTTGMLRALQTRGLIGKVIFVGFDQSPILATSLWKGWITALVLQDPYTMGYKSARRALDVLGMDAAEFRSKVETAGFSMTVTQHRVAEIGGLRQCQTYARDKGLGDLSGRPLADALLATARAKESKCLKDGGANCHPMFYTNIDDAGADLGQPGCNLNVLDLLYPPVEIWHLASPGRASK